MGRRSNIKKRASNSISISGSSSEKKKHTTKSDNKKKRVLYSDFNELSTALNLNEHYKNHSQVCGSLKSLHCVLDAVRFGARSAY